MSKRMYQIVTKPLTWHKPCEQIRNKPTDEADVFLTESIRQLGVLQAVGARSDGRLVWGHRRHRCAITAGLVEIPTVILSEDMSEGDFLLLQMTENVQRTDLSQYDLWQGCVRLLNANKWQLKDLAANLKCDPSWMTRVLSPSKNIPEAQESLRLGDIAIGDCYALSKLSEEDQTVALKARLSGEITTRDEMECLVKRLRSQKNPAKTRGGKRGKTASIKAILTSGLKVVVSGGKTLDQGIEALLELVKELKKANDQGWDAKLFNDAWAKKVNKA